MLIKKISTSAERKEFADAEYGEEVRGALISVAQKVEDVINANADEVNSTVDGLADLTSTIESANSIQESLSQLMDSSQETIDDIAASVTQANTANTNLTTTKNQATSLKSSLDTSISNANTAVQNTTTAKTALQETIDSADTIKSEIENMRPDVATTSRDGYMSADDKYKLDNIEPFAEANPEFAQKGNWLYIRKDGVMIGQFGPFNAESEDKPQVLITCTGSVDTGDCVLTAHTYVGTQELTENEKYLLGEYKWYRADDDPMTTDCLAMGSTYRPTEHGKYKVVLDGGPEPVAVEG